MSTQTCKDIQNDVCIDPTDRFETTSPVVHVSFKTTELPKQGDIYWIQWIAEDVGAAAPKNTVIGTLKEEVTDLRPGVQSYVVNSRMTRPAKGWPAGSYRVEVKLGDRLLTTARFVVK